MDMGGKIVLEIETGSELEAVGFAADVIISNVTHILNLYNLP